MPLSPDDGPDEILIDEFDEPPLEPDHSAVDPGDDGHGPIDEIVPFDLRSAKPSIIKATPIGPDPSREEKQPLLDTKGKELPEFDPRYVEDFQGLIFLGALAKSFEWMGHKFTIRTLTVGEQLLVALLRREYEGSIGEGLAYRVATAAMCVQKIDDQDLPIPVATDEDDFAYAKQRFDYAKARWFQYTVDAIYNEFLILDERTKQVILAMGKALGQRQSTPG